MLSPAPCIWRRLQTLQRKVSCGPGQPNAAWRGCEGMMTGGIRRGSRGHYVSRAHDGDNSETFRPSYCFTTHGGSQPPQAKASQATLHSHCLSFFSIWATHPTQSYPHNFSDFRRYMHAQTHTHRHIHCIKTQTYSGANLGSHFWGGLSPWIKPIIFPVTQQN